MARRKLLNHKDRRELFDIPTDEDILIHHYSFSPADRAKALYDKLDAYRT